MAAADDRRASLEVWQRIADGWNRQRRWMWDLDRRSPEHGRGGTFRVERFGLRNVEHRQLDAERMDIDDDSVDGLLRARIEEALQTYRADGGYAVPAVTQSTLAV